MFNKILVNEFQLTMYYFIIVTQISFFSFFFFFASSSNNFYINTIRHRSNKRDIVHIKFSKILQAIFFIL